MRIRLKRQRVRLQKNMDTHDMKYREEKRKDLGLSSLEKLKTLRAYIYV